MSINQLLTALSSTRIVMASLHEEAKESQKNIEDVEKVIDDPGLCKKICNSVYLANSTAISIEEDDGIVVHTFCDRMT